MALRIYIKKSLVQKIYEVTCSKQLLMVDITNVSIADYFQHKKIREVQIPSG